MPEPTFPDSQRPRQPGGRVGKYEVVRLIGKGAMGTVYLAHDPVLDRDVALKVMASHIADEAEAKQRFEREARAVARLTHPNVITVFDLGSDSDGALYIAMELLKGRDLQRAIRESAMPLERQVAVMVEVLAGLAAAHQAGIVHRDVKPANIFIQDDGSVKIMDFGVARLASGGTTGTGNIVGTADYMSPEQVKAGRVDGRSDLFSVGCMLFELACGRRPFHADDLMSIFYKITQEEPELSLLPKDPDHQALLPILRRALAKDAALRYQSAHEFAVELRGWLAARATSAASQAVLERLSGPEAPTRAPGLTQVQGATAASRPAVAARPPAARAVNQKLPARLPARRRSVLLPAIAALGVLAAAAAGGWLAWQRTRTLSTPPPTQALAPTVTPAAAVTPRPAPTNEPTAEPASPAALASQPATPSAIAPAAGRAAAALRAGQAAFNSGAYERAALAARAALREDTQSPAARKLLDDALAGQKAVALLASAETALTGGDLTAAEAALSQARRIAPWAAGVAAFAARLAEAEGRARQETQAKTQQARSAQLSALLEEGSSAMERRQFDAAVAAYNQVLALDPANLVAQTGKSNALTAKAVAEAAAAATAAKAPPGRSFVAGRTEAKGPDGGALVGFEDSPAVAVKKATHPAELPGRLVFEATPAAPRAGERFRIAVSLVNEGSQPIQLSGMNVVTTVNGRRQAGAVPPAASTVAPGARVLVWQTPGELVWREGTGSWSLEVVLRTSKGETYRNTLSWR